VARRSDAAVAGALMACVAEPVLAGLLGGGFLMMRRPDGRADLLDCFVQTPRRKRAEGVLSRFIHEVGFVSGFRAGSPGVAGCG